MDDPASDPSDPSDPGDQTDQTDPTGATDHARDPADAAAPEADAPTAARPRVPMWLQRTLMLLLLCGAVVGLVVTVGLATTGDDNTSSAKPDGVESLIPPSGAEVLRQAAVGLNLADGYDAYLIVNGTEIRSREDGLVKDLGTGLVEFVPGPGRPVEELEPERNCVIAMVWKRTDGPDTAQPASWCFTAA